MATAMVLAVQPKGPGRFWDDLNTPICKLKGVGKLQLGLEASLEIDLADKEISAVRRSRWRCRRPVLPEPRSAASPVPGCN